jgi:outer membrane lipoprotein-sorting protein
MRSRTATIAIGEVAKTFGGQLMNRHRSRIFPNFLLALILMASACGCATPVQTYPAMRDDDAARIISERLATIRTLSARCEVTLTNSKGDSVRLDGALAATSPNRLRLRAWKFDQAVFDLTLTLDGLWLFMGDDTSGAIRDKPNAISASQISQAWLMVCGGFFERNPSSIPMKARVRPILFYLKDESRTVRCQVDRRTLTPTKYSLSDSGGSNLYSVDLSDYRMINGIAWPMRIEFHSEDGVLSLRLDGVELNGEIAEGAFVPPSRAVKQP